MLISLALLVAAAFGAADQYLGSFSMHPWMADGSLLSAPWLLLAFIAGCTQRAARRAAILGLACTYAALAGYGIMTLSPIENAHLTVQTGVAFIRSESPIIVGGIVTGPLFGWLGQRWRTRRDWRGALAAAAALSLEPLARIPAHRPIRSSDVILAEVAVGLAMAAYICARLLARSGGSGNSRTA